MLHKRSLDHIMPRTAQFPLGESPLLQDRLRILQHRWTPAQHEPIVFSISSAGRSSFSNNWFDSINAGMRPWFLMADARTSEATLKSMDPFLQWLEERMAGKDAGRARRV